MGAVITCPLFGTIFSQHIGSNGGYLASLSSTYLLRTTKSRGTHTATSLPTAFPKCLYVSSGYLHRPRSKIASAL